MKMKFMICQDLQRWENNHYPCVHLVEYEPVKTEAKYYLIEKSITENKNIKEFKTARILNILSTIDDCVCQRMDKYKNNKNNNESYKIYKIFGKTFNVDDKNDEAFLKDSMNFKDYFKINKNNDVFRYVRLHQLKNVREILYIETDPDLLFEAEDYNTAYNIFRKILREKRLQFGFMSSFLSNSIFETNTGDIKYKNLLFLYLKDRRIYKDIDIEKYMKNMYTEEFNILDKTNIVARLSPILENKIYSTYYEKLLFSMMTSLNPSFLYYDKLIKTVKEKNTNFTGFFVSGIYNLNLKSPIPFIYKEKTSTTNCSSMMDSMDIKDFILNDSWAAYYGNKIFSTSELLNNNIKGFNIFGEILNYQDFLKKEKRYYNE